MKRILYYLALSLIALGLLLPLPATAQTDDEAVVQAVLFYSPSCPHCHQVINELLLPMLEDYGDRLQVAGIDTTQPSGGQLYQSAIEHYQIEEYRRGVPTLIIGDTVLVGSGEIPEQFPGLVEEHLAAGGIGWPDIPGLAELFAAAEATETGTEAEATAETETPPVEEEAEAETEAEATAETETPPVEEEAEAEQPTAETQPTTTMAPTPTNTATPSPMPTATTAVIAISQDNAPPTTAEAAAPPPDPIGFTLAGLVLVGMLLALGYAGWSIRHLNPSFMPQAGGLKTWTIPLLSLIGLGVSIYLAYVEITQVEAVCGPVGHCNVVQASPHARILGIPIAILGILNYLAIIILWVSQKIPGKTIIQLSTLGLLGLTLFGTFFSIYLTLVELFLIKAICAWCLTSAIVTTLLMLLVVASITGHSRPENVPSPQASRS